jgi:2'-5' RNA ligase
MAHRATREATDDAVRGSAPPDEWRLFVAIDVGAAREALRAAQERCRRAAFPLRPVDPAGAHLTLRFLGATDPARVPALGAALRAVAAAHVPFALRTAAPGAFPSGARARVLWLGLAGPVGRLLALHGATEAALADRGVPRESRPFQPHLTIGRIAPGAAPPAARTAALLAGLSVAAAPLPVAAIHLMRSVLGPGGARYTTLLTAPLHGAT